MDLCTHYDWTKDSMCNEYVNQSKVPTCKMAAIFTTKHFLHDSGQRRG